MVKDPLLADYVYRLAALPECPAFILYSASQNELIRISRYRYSAVSLWLRHLVLAEKLSEEAFLTDARYYQPLAEIAAAELKLATGLHPRTINSLIHSADSPAQLWFCLQLLQSSISLEEEGLFGERPVSSKRKNIKAVIKQLDDFEQLRFPYQENTANTVDELYRLLEIFHGEAQKIAKADSNFQIDYWNPYLRTVKRSINKVRNCKALQNLFLLPSGQIHWTEKGKKLPSAKKKTKKNESF